MDKVFLFPGQGSQYVGMGKIFYEKYDFAKDLYNQANDILEYKISEISFTDKNGILNQTLYTQPAIFVYSIVLDKFLKERGYNPIAVAGHSLGEYSALVSNNTITFEDGLEIIKERAKKMSEIGQLEPGAMAAVINTNIDKLKEILTSYKNDIVIANYNTFDQIILSGKKDKIEKFASKAKEYNIRRIIPLNVSGAFHSPLMKSARKYLEKFIKSTKFNMAKTPIYQNVYPFKNFDSEKIKNNLLNQLDNPVEWSNIITNMKNDNYKEFIEVGPKNVLSNFNRKLIPDLESLNVENIKEFNKING